MLTNEQIEQLRLRVIDTIREKKREALHNPAAYRAYIESTAHISARELGLDPSSDDIRIITEDLLGYGPITPLVSDTEITEIMITRYDKVYVEKNGLLIPTAVKFRSEEHLRTLVEKIAITTNRRLDESSPFVDTKLPDGTRVNITIPPITRNTTISLRRFPKPYTIEQLMEMETISQEGYEFIKEAIKSGLNFAISGSMSSGKTTLLNALIGVIGRIHGPQTSVVTYEDTLELKPDHENVRQFESKPPNIEGKGEVSLKHLAQTQMLRTRADWIVLGESRGAEVYYIVVMMCIGHSAMTTLHSFNARDTALYRLPSMIIMSEEGRAEGREGALSRTAAALDIIIHCAKIKQNDRAVRRVVQIAEVHRKQLPNGAEIPEVKEIFTYKNGKLVQINEPQIFGKRGW